MSLSWVCTYCVGARLRSRFRNPRGGCQYPRDHIQVWEVRKCQDAINGRVSDWEFGDLDSKPALLLQGRLEVNIEEGSEVLLLKNICCLSQLDFSGSITTVTWTNRRKSENELIFEKKLHKWTKSIINWYIMHENKDQYWYTCSVLLFF